MLIHPRVCLAGRVCFPSSLSFNNPSIHSEVPTHLRYAAQLH
jgi:hypothetical protein